MKWAVEFRNFVPLIHLLRDFLSEQKIGIFCQRPTSRAPSKPCYYSLHTNEALSHSFTLSEDFPFHKSNGSPPPPDPFKCNRPKKGICLALFVEPFPSSGYEL